VAADIIKTVAVDPTFSGAGALVIIVIIQTFLSFTWNSRFRVGGPGSTKIASEPPTRPQQRRIVVQERSDGGVRSARDD
jgi:hypothetical protein